MLCDYYKKKRNVFAFKVSKDAKIRNRYNQVPHLTQDTSGKVKITEGDCRIGIIRALKPQSGVESVYNCKYKLTGYPMFHFYFYMEHDYYMKKLLDPLTQP